MSGRLATLLALIASVAGSVLPNVRTAPHVQRRSPSTTWYHSDDHPVHALFKRGPTDGYTYAPVGSPAWSSGFPSGQIDVNAIPSAWMNALNAAVNAGKIPNIPQSTVNSQSLTDYGNLDPRSPAICSSSYQCHLPDDIWNAPDGVVAISFDDGPLPPSNTLYGFLANNSIRATHFFIGVNILANPTEFNIAFNQLGDDIALHTWTHPHMTTLTNAQLVGEFGWSMQLIHNSTGGRLPKYWRPPFGDSDNRVRAIAKEVFGLSTVIWNQDTGDWSLTNAGGTTTQAIHTEMVGWLTGPKSPGLMILEHELSDLSVQAFMDAYPIMKSNGWNPVSVADLVGGPVYQNSDNSSAPVTPGTVANLQVSPPSNSTSSAAPTSTASIASKTTSSSTSASPSAKPGNSNSALPLSHKGATYYLLTAMAAIGASILL